MLVLGVIPARGGSKSVPLKNIKKLCGQPLLTYTIASAKKSGSVDRLVVSTEDERIEQVAEDLSCEVVRRPLELAGDDSPTEDALIQAVSYLKEREGFFADVVMTLEPTSPFRSPETIDRCARIFEDTAADSVIGVVEDRGCYGKIKDERFAYLFPGQPRRRQDREPLYKESSTIYATRTEVLLRKRSVLGDNLYPLIISKEEAVDINTESDFLLAEQLMKRIKGK